MKNFFFRVHRFFAGQLGLNILQLIKGLYLFPYFIIDYLKFKNLTDSKIILRPFLHDKYDEAGIMTSEYFLQDLFIARKIFLKNPKRHVDIGSRIDGFVSNIASFREIEIFDVRPISGNVENIVYKQADLMNNDTNALYYGYTDSLSCLHTIEHFGLGRYGDSLHPYGYIDGIKNMSKLLKNGGIFYLSTPIGEERVEFNANRVFNPNTIINCAKKCNLSLVELSVINSKGDLKLNLPLEAETYHSLSKQKYSLGIFVFIKVIND
jgi:hypothetical protein